jgi:hypothetical protein
MNTRENHWQPVLPRITDPDMAPEEEFMVENAKATSAEFGANSAKSMVAAGALTSGSYMMNFFTQHKFKIIVAVVILLIALIILYMYITSKKKTDGGQPADLSAAPMGGKPPPNKAVGGAAGAVGGAGTGKSSDPSLEELNRVKEMRRQAKQLAEMKAANNASNPPNNAQPTSAFKFSPTMVSPAMRDSSPVNSSAANSAAYSTPANSSSAPMSTIFESVVDTPAAAANGGVSNSVGGAASTTDAPVQKTIVPHVSDDEDVDNLVNELTDNIESIDSGEVE